MISTVLSVEGIPENISSHTAGFPDSELRFSRSMDPRFLLKSVALYFFIFHSGILHALQHAENHLLRSQRAARLFRELRIMNVSWQCVVSFA